MQHTKFNKQLDTNEFSQKLRHAEPFNYQRGEYKCMEYVHLGFLKQARQIPCEKMCCFDAMTCSLLKLIRWP